VLLPGLTATLTHHRYPTDRDDHQERT